MIIFSTVFFSLLAISLILAIFFFFSFGNEDFSDFETNSVIHRYLQINPKTRETSRGLSSLPTETDSFFYSDELSSSYTLISRFDTTEFECTGSCRCVENRRNSATGKLLTRGLYFLVATFSVHLAVQHADEYFEDFCREELSHECPSSSITADVSVCSTIDEEKNVIEAEVISSEEEKETEKDAIYFCKGKCFPVSHIVKEDEDLRSILKGLEKKARKGWERDIKKEKCLLHELSSEVQLGDIFSAFFAPDKLKDLGFDNQQLMDEREKIQMGTIDGMEYAKTFFIHNTLHPFCLSKTAEVRTTSDGEERAIPMPVCWGFKKLEERVSSGKEGKEVKGQIAINPTVQCNKVS